ncbi:MAG: hotdog fold thioesterase [Nitrospirae bacterium]|nr:hotdog fold thioesterase [Nitrospirota bacterium]
MIWKGRVSLEDLNKRYRNTLVENLGIEFIEIGDAHLKATMPVDHRTLQPAGILHGGASLALAETLGSVAGFLCVDREKQYCIGMEINANHIRQVRSGLVYGLVAPVHIGRKTQVWQISINNQEGKLVCIARLTLLVLDREKRTG